MTDVERTMTKSTTGTQKAGGKRNQLPNASDSIPDRTRGLVHRSARGRFTESDDLGRSLTADRRTTAKRKVKSGYGDKGDR
jgi:hypothetical protein